MCGICGIISWGAPPDPERIAQMNALMLHRGPDDGGLWYEGPAALGHRRLSIIDLSPDGHQPLADTTGRYIISFNGEVYNYVQAREELQRGGHHFRTATDTEVILEAYKRWGQNFLNRLNGMFALAIWDREDRTLVLARDRLGKKPLYYALLPEGLTFASTVRALMQGIGRRRTLNRAALPQYFSCGYTWTNACLVDGVQKLPPGHTLTLRAGDRPKLVRYWDLAAAFRTKRHYRSLEDAGDELRSLIDDATALRLVGDVPVGAFLSSGIDSASIVGSVRANDASRQLRTFSAGFHERSFDERKEALALAHTLGVAHDVTLVPETYIDDMRALTPYFDEPLADTSLVAMSHLSRFARGHVTVALSGDGGDEVFGGYETYTADLLSHYLRFLPSSLLHGLGAAYARARHADTSKVSTDYKIRAFLRGASLPFPHSHLSWRELFSSSEIARLAPGLEVDPTVSPLASSLADLCTEVSRCHFLDQAMYIDLRSWLVEDVLVKVDRCSMAWSLEARAPLLDYRIVEFAAGLPVSFKITLAERKRVLREAMRGRLPSTVLNRKKRGFNVPFASFIQKHPDALRAALAPLKGLVAELEMKHLVEQHCRQERDHSFRLFALLALALWCDELNR